MTETLACGYSSQSTQHELSNEYQHDRVQKVFKNLCVIVLWTRVASALEGLITSLYSDHIQRGFNRFDEPRFLIQNIEFLASNCQQPIGQIYLSVKRNPTYNTDCNCRLYTCVTYNPLTTTFHVLLVCYMHSSRFVILAHKTSPFQVEQLKRKQTNVQIKDQLLKVFF